MRVDKLTVSNNHTYTSNHMRDNLGSFYLTSLKTSNEFPVVLLVTMGLNDN